MGVIVDPKLCARTNDWPMAVNAIVPTAATATSRILIADDDSRFRSKLVEAVSPHDTRFRPQTLKFSAGSQINVAIAIRIDSRSTVRAHRDILPTLAEVAHAAAPQNIDGLSILKVLHGETERGSSRRYEWDSGKQYGSNRVSRCRCMTWRRTLVKNEISQHKRSGRWQD